MARLVLVGAVAALVASGTASAVARPQTQHQQLPSIASPHRVDSHHDRVDSTHDLARWVDPFVGTAIGSPNFGTGGGGGNTYPGATRPFGMVQWSPDTLQNDVSLVGGYGYDDNRITGFSLTHMSGAGCSVYRDIPFLPTTAAVTSSPARPLSSDLASQFEPRFDHRHEQASPGYYSVTLDPNTSRAIGVQLSTTTRTGAARFRFPATARVGTVLVNAGGSGMADQTADVAIDPKLRQITGSAQSGQFCYQGGDYHVYFAARFDQPFASYGTWQRQTLHPHTSAASDKAVVAENYGPVPGGPSHISGDPSGTAQAGGYISFATDRHRVVQVRVGVSFVSVADAERNLAAEQPRFAFPEVHRAARRAWDRTLGLATVTGGSARDRRLYYTALYHAFVEPRTFSDVNGRYPGMDGKVHRAVGYTQYADFSGWDVYRSQVPLLGLLEPRRAGDLVRSLVADAEQSGSLPKWAFGDRQTEVMTGDPADQAIAAAYAMGARGFDVRAALRAMVRGATHYSVDAGQRYVERPGLVDYSKLGYIPEEEEHHLGGIASVADPAAVWGPAATTLEYADADYAIAALAQLSHHTSAATTSLLRRAGSWRTLVNPARHDIEPKSATGAFLPGFSPTSGDGFVEGDSAQYSWNVLHDPAALLSARGGRRASTRLLDSFFAQLNAGPASTHAYLGNEPDLHTPYLYDWSGAPSHGERVIRKALTTLYAPTPGGMPGNDDLGTMSSWWVLSALGVYPVMPGAPVLAIGTPLFPAATLHIGDTVVRIAAPHAGSRPYIAALRVAGHSTQHTWLTVAQLRHAHRLGFTMSRRPTKWGSHRADAPPSGAAALRPLID